MRCVLGAFRGDAKRVFDGVLLRNEAVHSIAILVQTRRCVAWCVISIRPLVRLHCLSGDLQWKVSDVVRESLNRTM